MNLEKLKKNSQPLDSKAEGRAKPREESWEWINMSQEIALSLHYYLRTRKMTQKVFAQKMGVSPVYVGKVLKGKENLTLETICKLQKVLRKRLVIVERPYHKSAPKEALKQCETFRIEYTAQFAHAGIKAQKKKRLRNASKSVTYSGSVVQQSTKPW